MEDMKMFTNKYLNFGYISVVALILGLVISTSYVNTAQATEEEKIELKFKGMGDEKMYFPYTYVPEPKENVSGEFDENMYFPHTLLPEPKENVSGEFDENMYFPHTLLPALRIN
jgi:hypothetical protein